MTIVSKIQYRFLCIYHWRAVLVEITSQVRRSYMHELTRDNGMNVLNGSMEKSIYQKNYLRNSFSRFICFRVDFSYLSYFKTRQFITVKIILLELPRVGNNGNKSAEELEESIFFSIESIHRVIFIQKDDLFRYVKSCGIIKMDRYPNKTRIIRIISVAGRINWLFNKQ